MRISDLPFRALRRALQGFTRQPNQPVPQDFPSDELRHVARQIGAFDEAWYRHTYPDVAASGMDPFTHYMRHGWQEQRQPTTEFNIQMFFARWRELQPDQDNPLTHFLQRTPPPQQSLKGGLCIGGHILSEIGLGQATRNLGYACDEAKLPVSFRNLAVPERENDLEFADRCDPWVDRKGNLIVVGLPSVMRLRHEIGPGRLNILFPFWELSRVPKEWHAAIRGFDEIWAPSRFIASAFGDIPDMPVHYLPQPVRLPPKVPEPRTRRTAVRFFTYLDFDSSIERKNPKATVEAFLAAFPARKRDVALLVKTRGVQDHGLRKWLAEHSARDDRIQVIDRTLDRTGMDALMAESDAFVSLHRSEGFGFGPAEALAAGRPAVATDFSSTSEFITDETGYPVACTLEPLRNGDYVHTKGQFWATADRDAAVAALRMIYDHPAEAEARARRGFALLRERHSLAIVGGLIRQMLKERDLI